ncbi:MAG: hypothetical protein AMXMBFR33_72610 [Candidatus Xenobia bacterium]|jgi:hypothetical protein
MKELLFCLLLMMTAGPALIVPRAQFQGFLSVGGPGQSNPPGGLLVIRDQKAFDAFVDRIPSEQITPTRPAPPSDDPLLKRPRIDFSRSTVVVAYSGSMLTRVSIEKLALGADGKSVTATVKREPVDEVASVPLGVGRYHCVVIDRRDGEIREQP